MIQPEQTTQVTFHLTERDLSYHNGARWVRSTWAFAYIGESSVDIRQEIEVQPWKIRESWWPILGAVMVLLAIGAVAGGVAVRRRVCRGCMESRYQQQESDEE